MDHKTQNFSHFKSFDAEILNLELGDLMVLHDIFRFYLTIIFTWNKNKIMFSRKQFSNLVCHLIFEQFKYSSLTKYQVLVN